MALPSLRDFTSGVGQGWNTGQSMFDAGVAGLARSVGATGMARDWEQSADEQAREAAQYANPGTQVAPWREGGGGWAGAAPWLANQAGQLVGGTAPLVAGGVAGMAAAPFVPEAVGGAALASGLGMGLASYPQAVGANYQAERDANAAQGLGEVTPEQAQSAATWGVPSAALNAFAPTRAIGLGQTASQMASRTMLEAAKDVAKVGIDNAIATGGQKAIEHGFRPDMSDEDKQKDMFDSIVTGFIGGAAMGGAGEVAGRAIKAVRGDTPTQDLDAITKSILEPEKAAQDAVQEQGPEGILSREPAEAGGSMGEGDAFGQEAAGTRQGIEGDVSFLDEGQAAPQEVTPPDVPRQYLVEAERAARDGTLDDRMAAAEQGGDTLRSQAFSFMKSLLADESGALKTSDGKLKIPAAFARDRIERDLPMPEDGEFKGNQFVGTFTPEQIADLMSDAKHYATDGMDEAPRHVVSSAKRTLDILNKAKQAAANLISDESGALKIGEEEQTVEKPTGFRVDNPGGRWLQEKQEDAYLGKNKTAQKGLKGTPTAFAGTGSEPLMLPVSELSKVGGVNDEVRKPGDLQYDELMKSVKENGYTNENPVMVFVNHKGEPYINEGNTRIAVAKDAGVDKIKSWVHWYNGGEQAPGKWTPSAVAAMERGQPKAPVITRDVGGAVAHFAETPNGIERIPSPADAKQPIDFPAGTPPIEGPKGVAPAVPPLPPREAIPPSPARLMSPSPVEAPAPKKGWSLKAAKNSAASFLNDESGSLRITRKPIPMETADGAPLRTPTEIDGALKRFLRNVDFGSAGDAARKLGLYVTTNHHHDEMYGHIMPSQLEYSQSVAHRAAISQRMQADAMGNQAKINDFARKNAKLAEHTRNVERAYKLGMDPSKPWEAQPQRVQKGDLYETYKNLHGDFQKSYNALRSTPGGMEMHDVMREQYATHWMSKPAAVLYTLLNDLADLPEELRAGIVDPSERLINDPEAAKGNSFVNKLMSDSLEQNLQIAKAYLDAQEKVETKKILDRTKTEKSKEAKFMAGVSDHELKKDFGKLLKTDEEYKVKTGSAPVDSALRDLVNDIERQKGLLKDVPYSALTRSGKYGVGFRLKSDENGIVSNEALQKVKASIAQAGFNNVVVDPLANQDYVFIRSDNKTMVNNLRDLIKSHVKEGDVLREDFQAGTMDAFSKSPAASKTIDKIIRQIESDDRYTPPEGASEELKKDLAARKQQMVAALRNIAVDFLPEASMAKYDEHRSYIPGFEADPLSSMARQSVENAQHVSNLLGTYRVNKSLAKMRAEWEAAKDPMSDNSKYEPIMAALYARNAGKEEARGIQLGASPFEALTSLNYSYYLGLNPSFGIIQMSQIPMYVIPELGKRYGFMNSTKAIGKTFAPSLKILAAVAKEAKKVGGNAIADMPITIDALKSAGLDDETSRFMIHMVNSGGIDTGGLARSLGHIAESRTGGWFDNATRWSSAIGYYGETLSRIQTALMAKEVFKGDKRNDISTPEGWNKLIEHTHKVLNEALFDYSNENRATGFSDDPRSLLGRSTKLAFAFQAYWMMAIEKQYRELHRLFTDANPEHKKEAAKFLLGHLGTTALIAGSLGIPGMSAFQKAYEKFEDWKDPESGPHDMREDYSAWLEHTLGRDVGDAVAYGAPRLFGQDWSKRTGEQDFLPVPTFVYDRGSWKDAFNKWALAKEGPVEGAFANVMTSIDKFNAGDVFGAMTSVLPAAGLRNAMNTARAVSSGHYRDSRGHTVPNVEPTTGGVVSGFLGFTPKNLAREREENAMLHRYDNSIEYDARNLVMPMVDALRDGDKAAFNRMLPKARDFERMHPGHKIVDRAQETFKREYKDLNTAEKTGMPYQRWKDDPKRKERAARYVEGVMEDRGY